MTKYALIRKNRIPALQVISENEDTRYVNNAEDAYVLAKEEGICDLPEEYLYLIALNTRNRVLGIFEVSHGDSEKTLVSIPQILTRALLVGSKRIIIMHNHPSGDVTPSSFDSSFTNDLNKACDVLKIKFEDHLIVSEKTYISYSDAGHLWGYFPKE